MAYEQRIGDIEQSQQGIEDKMEEMRSQLKSVMDMLSKLTGGPTESSANNDRAQEQQ